MQKSKGLIFLFSIKEQQLSFVALGIKAVAYLIVGLYATTWGFNWVNIYGQIDALVPMERGMLLLIGLTFLFFSIVKFVAFGRQFKGIVQA